MRSQRIWTRVDLAIVQSIIFERYYRIPDSPKTVWSFASFCFLSAMRYALLKNLFGLCIQIKIIDSYAILEHIVKLPSSSALRWSLFLQLSLNPT